jgi:hypothetical protein
VIWSYNKVINTFPTVSLKFSKQGILTEISTKLSTEQPFTEEQVVVRSPKIKPGIESNIFTEDVSKVTSQNMQGIKEAILLAHKQREELATDLETIKRDLKQYQDKLRWSYILLYGLIIKRIRRELQDSIINQKSAIGALENYIIHSTVALNIHFDNQIQVSFDHMFNRFKQLSKSDKIWDLTASYKVDRFTTRSSANTEVYRTEVSCMTGHLKQITSDIQAMIFQNANGADLYFYPNFVVLWNHLEEFAIIGFEEIDIEVSITRFIEDGTVPNDSKTVDRTWAKVNKNGSPDLRFKGNYQIPIVEYGEISIKTETGLNERFQFSSVSLAEAFVKSFIEYQIQVIRLEYVASFDYDNSV